MYCDNRNFIGAYIVTKISAVFVEGGYFFVPPLKHFYVKVSDRKCLKELLRLTKLNVNVGLLRACITIQTIEAGTSIIHTISNTFNHRDTSSCQHHGVNASPAWATCVSGQLSWLLFNQPRVKETDRCNNNGCSASNAV